MAVRMEWKPTAWKRVASRVRMGRTVAACTIEANYEYFEWSDCSRGRGMTNRFISANEKASLFQGREIRIWQLFRETSRNLLRTKSKILSQWGIFSFWLAPLQWPNFAFQVFVTPLYDTLPLDAVVGRCLVMDVHTYCKGRPKYPKYSEEDIYICEYRVDKGQRLFGRMHVRNRFPIAMKPYIFQSFLKKLHIRRDFTVRNFSISLIN